MKFSEYLKEAKTKHYDVGPSMKIFKKYSDAENFLKDKKMDDKHIKELKKYNMTNIGDMIVVVDEMGILD